MEGAPLSTCEDDAGDHCVHVAQYLSGGNAEGRETATIEPIVATDVASGLVATVVNFAVDLDREARGKAGEVDPITHLWRLPTKFEPARTGTERLPKQHFRKQHLLSRGACGLYLLYRRAENLG